MLEETETVNALIRNSGIVTSEATMLLAECSGLRREQLITHAGRVDAAIIERYRSLCARRSRGEPMAYLIGWREFYERAFTVTPDVLIPRPETELLVEQVLQVLPSGGNFLDLGTGSGVIAISVACECPGAHVTASDVSYAALKVAQENAARLNARVSFIQSDWLASIPTPHRASAYDVIASNPPYIALGDAHLDAGDLRFEPRLALTDGIDSAQGLSALHTIIQASPPYLKTGGWLYLEHGYDQAAAVRSLLTATGFLQVQTWRDLAGIERLSAGQWSEK